MSTKYYHLILLCCSLLLTSTASSEEAQLDLQLNAECKSALLMEASTGQIIGEKDSHKAMAPASMVKMMTAYVIFQQIEEDLLKLDDIVTTSAFASKIGGSQVYLREHEQFTVMQLLEAVLVQSANDAAVALAEHVAGESSGFVAIMNNTAGEIGMKESVFHSPHGLPPAKGQEPDMISAYDLAVLGRALITDFPESIKYTGKNISGFRNDTFEMRNHNALVRTFPGCDGIKTGYYRKAGFGVTATAMRNDLRMIAVVVGCPRSKLRNAEASRLLSIGLATYRASTIIKKGETIEQTLKIRGGKKKKVALVAAEDLKVVAPAMDLKKIVVTPVISAQVKAPVQAGAVSGKLAAKLNGKVIGQINLLAAEEVKQSWIGKIMGVID